MIQNDTFKFVVHRKDFLSVESMSEVDEILEKQVNQLNQNSQAITTITF